MTEIEKLKSRIEDAIYTNTEGAITGNVLQNTLKDMVDTIDTKVTTEYISAEDADTVFNGMTEAISGKADASAIPTRTSQLTNDSSFITQTDVNNGLYKDMPYIDPQTGQADPNLRVAVPYATTEDVYNYSHRDHYTKDEVDAKMSDKQDAVTNGTVVQIVNAPSAATRKKLELVNEAGDEVTTIVTSSDINSGWSQGGDTRLATIGMIKAKLAEKADASDLADYYTKDEVDAVIGGIDFATYFDGVEYDSSNTRINFKHGNTVLAYISASAFIKDGMVSNVAISNGNLVVTFNTDAGKEPISIPLTSIFDPSNYYSKQQADDKFATSASLSSVATSGSYNDLSNKPTIPDVSGKANTADLATVATSGSYNDLSNKPTIPTTLASLTDDSTHRVVTDTEKSTWSGKQDALTFDDSPTSGSNNPVKSGGVYTALLAKADQSTTYTKTEVNNLIVPANTTISVVQSLPSSGSANTIYRVQGQSSYTDWGWDGTQYIALATYNGTNLYSSVGDNIDGAMTQKATTKAINDAMKTIDISALLNIIDVAEDGFYFIDENYYIGVAITNNGLIGLKNVGYK